MFVTTNADQFWSTEFMSDSLSVCIRFEMINIMGDYHRGYGCWGTDNISPGEDADLWVSLHTPIIGQKHLVDQ